MGIMVLVTVLILGIYGNSFNAFRRGTSRLEVQQRAREVIRRVTPLIMSSKAPTPLDEAVIEPPTGESRSFVEFHTADDLLGPMAPINPRAPTHLVFRIWFSDNDKSVRVSRLSAVGGSPVGDVRFLGHRVNSVEFERLAVNLVRVSVSVTAPVITAVSSSEEIEVLRSAVVSIPYYSSAR